MPQAKTETSTRRALKDETNMATARSREDSITAHFRRSRETLERAVQDGELMQAMIRATDTMATALRGGNKILIAGNGGSAADAQHIAGEFLSRLNFDRNPLPAVALTTDSSVLTAIGNDYGFEQVFERQVRGLARQGDVLLAISTSGRSPNILAGLRAARAVGATTVGFTGGSDSPMLALCDIAVRAPSDSTPQIQQIHIVAAHAICGLIEQELFGPPVP
jgi:D-sedoheptulose 7-phosphate isomerase